MEPRGTCKSRPSTAHSAPKCLCKDCVSIASSIIVTPSLVVRVFGQLKYVFPFQPELLCLDSMLCCQGSHASQLFRFQAAGTLAVDVAATRTCAKNPIALNVLISPGCGMEGVTRSSATSS